MSRSATSAIDSQINNNGSMTQSFTYHQGTTMPINTPALPFGTIPATEVPQRISIYAKEPRRLGQISIQQTAISGSRINTFVNVHPQKVTPKVISVTGKSTKLPNLKPTIEDQSKNSKSSQQLTPTSSVTPSIAPSTSSKKTIIKPPVPPQASNK